jgi:hypothetical protein
VCGEEKSTQTFEGVKLKELEHLENIDENMEIILKHTLKHLMEWSKLDLCESD